MGRRTLVVGLTGGIGTGKTEALREFARRGAATISLDEAARRLSRRGGPLYRRVVSAFGAGILDARGEIDRVALGERVFSRPSERRRLERLTHPAILREMRRRLKAARGRLVVVDVPLLFEGGYAAAFDVTMAISARPRTQLSRVLSRDGVTAAQARRRMGAQLPTPVKEALADVVVRNEGSLKDFRSRISQYHKAFELISRSPAAPYGGRRNGKHD